ncbi:MAG TPA: hypothetical protein EYP04_08945 [Anaerolineae bacterium]|nr:hypothetical protein [Anaerolineae bacterium]
MSINALVHDDTPVFFYQVSQWEPIHRQVLYRVLLPTRLMAQYGIDPITLTNQAGEPAVQIACSTDTHLFSISIWRRSDDQDPLMILEMGDTVFNRIEAIWLATNDPESPRFDVDRDGSGRSTLLGTARRNLEAEEAAMRAGLAPGQVRRGLRVFSRLLWRLETFMACMNQRELVVEPLAYHNAILFERHGFAYASGQRRMEWIHQAFRPGGELYARLDSSTPFRQPEMAATVRGRSWAIHDGILEEPWGGIKMVKRIGYEANVETFPGGPW